MIVSLNYKKMMWTFINVYFIITKSHCKKKKSILFHVIWNIQHRNKAKISAATFMWKIEASTTVAENCHSNFNFNDNQKITMTAAWTLKS